MVGCSRPTCPEVAAIALGYDAVRRIAWFRDLDDVAAGEATVRLCEQHARAVTLPVGWVGRDERIAEPALWLSADAPVPAARRTPARRRSPTPPPLPTAPPEVEELPLWVRERRDPAVHMAVALYGDEPHAEQDLEEPRGPLMARAFRAAGLG